MEDNVETIQRIFRWRKATDEYNALKHKCKELVIEIEQEKYRLINSPEYDGLKITEKKLRADNETSKMQLELIDLEKERDDSRAECEMYNKILQYSERD